MEKKVLFVCIHHSARSQMAEAFLNHLAGERFEAQSAGTEPGRLNPFVVEAMREIGINISSHKTKSVRDLIRQGKVYDYVITVCDEAGAERCPVFPGGGQRVHMGFPDPASFQGGHEEKLARTREVREAILARLQQWLDEDRV